MKKKILKEPSLKLHQRSHRITLAHAVEELCLTLRVRLKHRISQYIHGLGTLEVVDDKITWRMGVRTRGCSPHSELVQAFAERVGVRKGTAKRLVDSWAQKASFRLWDGLGGAASYRIAGVGTLKTVWIAEKGGEKTLKTRFAINQQLKESLRSCQKNESQGVQGV